MARSRSVSCAAKRLSLGPCVRPNPLGRTNYRSVDPVSNHSKWAIDIEVGGYKVNYPMIGDTELTSPIFYVFVQTAFIRKHTLIDVATKLFAQIKDHVNRGLYFDRLSVEEVRLVAPGPDGVHGRRLQHGRTTDDSKVLDRTAFRYRGLQDYDSLNVGRLGDCRIWGQRLCQ
jgi:hypothetical protein